MPSVVRMRGLFGQVKQEFAFGCPNARLIRTGQAGICLWLSECAAYSDRSSKILPLIVRMQGSFGQVKQEFAFGCPNARLIRTGQAGIYLWLSECKAHSDRSSRNLPSVVRMRGLFGQDKQDLAFGCPNARLIRTG
ncbi:hypothetical protein QNH20_24150 [Neobacillus sp. WH10]|uniref:hypothetical protein n=1 Tax=Neobacillus sp. WH10 TaxID=3047873 RepID=UPI0024C1F1BD|nr:hypothetical protein [Neobacillus sp. WH10]WHY77139.1 hypothetical protein QNH20_24150 [Neobacillus sp. WH10]